MNNYEKRWYEVRYKFPHANKMLGDRASYATQEFDTFEEAQAWFEMIKEWELNPPARTDIGYQTYRNFIGHCFTGVIVLGLYDVKVTRDRIM